MVSKTPKFLILFVILAVAGAVVVAGCGGGSSSSSESTAAVEEEAETKGGTEAEEEGTAEEEPATEAEGAGKSEEETEAPEEEAGAGESAMLAEGKTIFTTTCASCHTLKEAGTSGEVGPNLDELEPSQSTVEHQVENGGGGMPAFGKEGILKPDEIKAVATYVSSVAGTE
jgi:mono/diheme cytochrome c family protein